jgi:hypothetical protein
MTETLVPKNYRAIIDQLTKENGFDEGLPLGWLSKCRGLLIRYDKNDFNYLGLIQLACALLWYRRIYRLQAA